MAGDWDTIFEALQTVDADQREMQHVYGECLNTMWILYAAALVVFMHPGFSLLEAGCVRFKNAQNILTKNFMVVTIGFITWYFVGWGFAFGASENRFFGATGFVFNGMVQNRSSLRLWFFQGAFCATAGTIVSGAMAERTQLKGFAIFTILMTSIIYPMIVFWGWSGRGFLNYKENPEDDFLVSIAGPGLVDFAGSGIVHLTGGMGALIGCVAVGPRKGRFEPGMENEFAGHSIPFCVIGTFFLWFGWYGFNPGSTLAMDTYESATTAGLVAVNSTLSACVAGIVVFLLRALVVEPKCLDVGAFCNGILVGLVGITAGCATLAPWEAIIVGLCAGCAYQGCSRQVIKFGIDDVVDAISVHGAGGLLGLLAPGFFGAKAWGGNGAIHGGDQLGTQIVAAFLICLWTGTLSTIILIPLRLAGWLRMSDEFQDNGADFMEHSPAKAYNDRTTDES